MNKQIKLILQLYSIILLLLIVSSFGISIIFPEIGKNIAGTLITIFPIITTINILYYLFSDKVEK